MKKITLSVVLTEAVHRSADVLLDELLRLNLVATIAAAVVALSIWGVAIAVRRRRTRIRPVDAAESARAAAALHEMLGA